MNDQIDPFCIFGEIILIKNILIKSILDSNILVLLTGYMEMDMW